MREKPPRGLSLARYMLPLTAALLIFRFFRSSPLPFIILAALTTVASIIFVIRVRSWRHWDEARLLLAATARSKTTAAPPSNVSASRQNGDVFVLAHPRRRKRLRLEKHGGMVIGIVGNGAKRYAQWIGAQLLVMGEDIEVMPAAEAIEDALAPSVPIHTWKVVWAVSVAEIPTNSGRILPAQAVGSTGWSRQIGDALIGERPLPRSVDLAALLDEEPLNGNVSVGVTEGGTFGVDLERDGPHVLVVGGTGAGKSEFLTTLVMAHATVYTPDELRIVLLDFKGGAGLEHLATLPHVEHALTDLDQRQTAWLVRTLGAILQSRKQVLRDNHARTWSDLAASPPRLLVVVDEFHVLAESQPDLLADLVALAAQGRSLGIHLVLATQRPSGAVNAQMRATLDLRVALRCTETSDSVEAIGTPNAAHLPRVPGRAIISGEVVQVALTKDSSEMIRKITAALDPKPRAKVVPDPLPAEIKISDGNQATSNTFGVYETPGEGVQPLHDPGRSVAILGPPAVQAELTSIAKALTENRYYLPRPQTTADGISSRVEYIGSDLPLAEATRRLCAALANASNAGSSPHNVIVIDELSDLLTRIEVASRPNEGRQLWRRLIDRSIHGRITLIVTDTHPRFDLSALPQRILRVPRDGGMIAPSLIPYIPTHRSGYKPFSPGGSENLYIDPIFGRVLAQGFVGSQPVLAQIPTEPKNHWIDRFQHPSTGARLVSPPPTLIHALQHATAVCISGLEVLSELPDLEPSFRHGIVCLEASAWPAFAPYIGRVAIAVEPSLEVVRMFVQRFPEDAPWLMSSFPYRNRQGLVSTGDAVYFVEDVQQVVDLLDTPPRTKRSSDDA